MRLMALAAALGVLLGAARPRAQEQSFPHTKQRGRATAEYKDDRLHVVANYDFSQRRHDSAWLLIDVAASTVRPMVLGRADVTLVTPSGMAVTVASHQQVREDRPRVGQLVQNAKVLRRQLASYFNQHRLDPMQFFDVAGLRTVTNSTVLADDRVTLGELFFKTPRGRWEAGTYSLVIDLKEAHAALPITLE